MRVPVVAPVLRGGGGGGGGAPAERPVQLGLHVAKDALVGGEEVGPVRALAPAQLPRAVPAVRARDQVREGGPAGAAREAAARLASSSRGGGRSLAALFAADAVVFEVVGAGGGVGGVPEFDRLGRRHAGAVPAVAFGVGGEEHGRVLAVEARVLVVVAGQVGEVLHVDLQGGGRDAVAVVVVDPGACWFDEGDMLAHGSGFFFLFFLFLLGLLWVCDSLGL